MGVISDGAEISVEQLRKSLANWFQTRETTAVHFIENANPEEDPYSRYTVAYDSVFEPNALDRARIEISLTTDGTIGVGLETKKRIAERLGIKGGKNKIFAAGHEPSEVSEEGLLALLTVVAEGKVAISTTCLPLLGLIRTNAVLHADTDKFLATRGYDARWWLTVVDDFESDAFRHVLRFTTW